MANPRTKKCLNILQWNARSVVANKPSLVNYIQNNPTDVIILAETWIKPSTKFSITGYNLVHNSRNDGKGGVGILISKNFAFTKEKINANFNASIEICAVHLNVNNVTIASIYKPPNVIATKRDWDNIFSQFSAPTIFCGDFNAHHSLWGCCSNNNQGNRLVDAIDGTNLVVLNDGNPTRVTSPFQLPSAVDLTLVTSDLVSKSHWKILTDPMGSDHYPISLSFELNILPNKINPSSKWKDRLADWSVFHTKLESQFANISPDNNDNAKNFTVLTDAISNAANETMPLRKPFIPARARPIWWDDECTNMVNSRKDALSKYKSVSNLENFLIYKNIEAKTKFLFRQKRKKSWNEFLSKLNKNTSPSQIWSFLKKINNKNYESKKVPLSSDLIEKLLDHFAPSYVENFITNKNTSNSDAFVPENILEQKFTLTELDFALNDIQSTAPGLDSFTYTIIKNCPKNAKLFLLNIYNDWWLKGRYIDQFKAIIICLILKPNQDGNSPSSYRPISLMSCLAKTFERMIKARLEWYLEHKSLLPKTQYGFRRGQGTIDAVSQLVMDVQSALSNNAYVACIFLDLKGAYDAVDLNILHKKLSSFGININVSSSITELYRNRQIYIKDHNNYLWGPRTVYQGLPQGSVLSPLLFNVYTADLHDMVSDSIKCIQYADDFCLYTIHDTYNGCMANLRQIVECVKIWLLDSGFSMSPEKSAVMVFTRHRLKMGNTLDLSGYNFPVVNQYKYLGIILDTKLLWTKHITYVKTKCEKGINMLKCVSKNKWGADPKISLMFYRAYIRSILDYGCVLYGSTSNTNLLSLDRIQYKSIRICIGAMKSSPCQAILAEAQEPPLALRRQYLANKMMIKIRTFSANKTLNNIYLLNIENLTNSYWRLKNSPPLVDAFIETEECDKFITKYVQYPIFQNNFDVLMFKPTVKFPIYTECSVQNNNLVKSLLNNYQNYSVIYTDGSKSISGTGSAFYVSDINLSFRYRIQEFCSIFTAEAYAIERALVWINQNNIGNAIILTDSKSVLQAISTSVLKHYKNIIIYNIRELLYSLSCKQTIIRFIWTRGHVGITGNETVDQSAKEATKFIKIDRCPSNSDIGTIFKQNIRKNWEEIWLEYVNTSHSPYTLIHPTLPKSIPHIMDFCVSKSYSTIITRLRLNHGCFPAHLFKIGLNNTSLCSCDNSSVCDMNHLFFSCKNHPQVIAEFETFLKTLSMQFPTNITSLLSSHNKQIYDAIVNFIRQARISI